ncbi:rod-binding protein [Sphingomonas phyllosphaerae]|uniref:rod-binding protein n=1 Tax=Sphingomonas phyllosphaerae TaxID=257003 RepID=UPI0003B2E33B|nr:rod-binding protein [Sphingomonas phyllosphaerae]
MADAVTAPTGAITRGITGQTGIDSGLGRAATKENLDKASQQFESVFTGMMLKSMRAAKLADPLIDSKAMETFRDMSDQKVVQQMAEHTPLGIGAAMSRFLAQSQPEIAAKPASKPDLNPNRATLRE